jgi:hypothetical protein
VLSAEEEFDLSEVMAEEVATILSKEEMLQQVRGAAEQSPDICALQDVKRLLPALQCGATSSF